MKQIFLAKAIRRALGNHKVMALAVGGFALAGVSGEAAATFAITYDSSSNLFNSTGISLSSGSNVWDGGNIYTIGSSSSTSAVGPSYGETDKATSSSLGWNHNLFYKVFEISTAGGYSITLDRTASSNAKPSPALSLWTTGSAPWDTNVYSHSFSQVVGPADEVPDGTNANTFMAANGTSPHDDGNGNIVNGVTGFVGYANAGAWFYNGDGNLVKGAQDQEASHTGVIYFSTTWDGDYNGAEPGTGTNITSYYSGNDGKEIVLNNTTGGAFNVYSGGGWDSAHSGEIRAAYAGAGSSVETGDGHAQLNAWLMPGWYVLAAGSSCWDLSCVSTTGGTISFDGTLTVLENSSISAPAAVPVPGALWLFAGAMASLGLTAGQSRLNHPNDSK